MLGIWWTKLGTHIFDSKKLKTIYIFLVYLYPNLFPTHWNFTAEVKTYSDVAGPGLSAKFLYSLFQCVSVCAHARTPAHLCVCSILKFSQIFLIHSLSSYLLFTTFLIFHRSFLTSEYSVFISPCSCFMNRICSYPSLRISVISFLNFLQFQSLFPLRFFLIVIHVGLCLPF